MAPIGNLTGVTAPQSMTWQQSGSAAPSTAGFNASDFDSLLGATLNGISGLYGSQNASEAQNKGILAGIGTQQNTMGNINSLFGTQKTTGDDAFKQLGKTLGLDGGAPDYSGFQNNPGYLFAQQQGMNAIRTGAAANGSAYTPNTWANIGSFVTGTASTNYNNYVDQLMKAAGFGSSANNTLAGANLTTGGNISQLQQNSGNAEASGSAGGASAVGGLIQSLLGNGTVQKGIGNLVGSLFGGSSVPDAAGAFAGLDASTGAAEAGVASDVAASNAAALGGVGGAGGAGASGASALGGTGASAGAGAGAGAGTGIGDVGAGAAGASGAASSLGNIAGGIGSIAGGAGSAGAAAGALGAGAPGVFASGSAGAVGGGAGSAGTAGSLGAAGAAGGIAATFAIQQAALALGDAWTAKNTQGSAAMKAWMKATGSTWVPNKAANTNNGSTFGNYNGYQPTGNGKVGSGVSPGDMFDAQGKKMSPAQASAAIYNWAIKNGVNPGDFHP